LSTKKDYLTFIQFFYFSRGYSTEPILQSKKKGFSQKSMVCNWYYDYLCNAVIATLVRVDKFGIREIYQTKNGGSAVQEWYFNTDNPGNDPRTGGENAYSVAEEYQS
jgi:hypothetical protein